MRSLSTAVLSLTLLAAFAAPGYGEKAGASDRARATSGQAAAIYGVAGAPDATEFLDSKVLPHPVHLAVGRDV